MKAPTAQRPILFVTVPGRDPAHEIDQLARDFSREHGEPVTVRCIALGGGLEKEATEMVRKAASEGDWVFVKNLHYAPNWLPSVEVALKDMERCDSFRCFLSTEAAEHLTDSVLYSSVFKVSTGRAKQPSFRSRPAWDCLPRFVRKQCRVPGTSRLAAYSWLATPRRLMRRAQSHVV